MAASAARLARRRSKPLTVMLPPRLWNSRVTSDISVVLPAPFGPRSAVNEPAGTRKLTSSSARRPRP